MDSLIQRTILKPWHRIGRMEHAGRDFFAPGGVMAMTSILKSYTKRHHYGRYACVDTKLTPAKWGFAASLIATSESSYPMRKAITQSDRTLPLPIDYCSRCWSHGTAPDLFVFQDLESKDNGTMWPRMGKTLVRLRLL